MQLDQEIYGPFYKRMSGIARNIKPEEWVLQGQGTMFDEDVNDLAVKPSSGEIGFWLLVFLSTFLEEIQSSHIQWGLLFYALDKVGWSKEDYLPLLEGSSLPLLLKPDLRNSRFVVSDEAPYWNNMVPTQSFKRGWLSLEEISDIKSRLMSSQNAILSLSEENLASYSESVFINKSKKPALHAALNNLIALLESTENNHLGLLIIVSW